MNNAIDEVIAKNFELMKEKVESVRPDCSAGRGKAGIRDGCARCLYFARITQKSHQLLADMTCENSTCTLDVPRNHFLAVFSPVRGGGYPARR